MGKAAAGRPGGVLLFASAVECDTRALRRMQGGLCETLREARVITPGANVRKQGKDYSNADLVCYDDDIQVF